MFTFWLLATVLLFLALTTVAALTVASMTLDEDLSCVACIVAFVLFIASAITTTELVKLSRQLDGLPAEAKK